MIISQKAINLWTKGETWLFPPPPFIKRDLTLWQYLLAVGGSALIFSTIGFLVKADGFIGYDWYHAISRGQLEPYYPPWSAYLKWITWPGLIGLSCAGLFVGLYQRRASLLVTVAAFLSLPLLWVLFLGQIDGIVLLGLTGLPWLTPIATLKPQVSAFAFLADKRWFVVFILWILLTILIWGFWPLDMLNHDAHWQKVFGQETYTQPQNISLWPWAIPMALVMLCLSRGDMDMLMLAGTFVTPHLIPYSYIVVMPAIARVRRWLALTLVALTWLPLSANWVGAWGWYLGHLFAIVLWIALYRQRQNPSLTTTRH
jgi:hypothetical protein